MTELYTSELLAGVDEAGRGPLVGPVVAGAVMLDPEAPIQGLADSKKLSEKKREALALLIKEQALAWAIAEASVAEIQSLNILQASLLAMQRAVTKLRVTPKLVWVDGLHCPELPMQTRAIVKGDDKVQAISAAGILAKVARDAKMFDLDKKYPQYGFAKHKGYPTKQHLEAMRLYGIMEEYRLTFKPVQKIAATFTEHGEA